MSIARGLFGGGKKSSVGAEAAGLVKDYNEDAMDLISDESSRVEQYLYPFLNAGVDALGDLREGTTAEGLDERLSRIFNTSTFGSLVDERERAMQGQLAAGGLTRSGTAMQEMARIPTDIGMMLEQMMTGRSQQLAGAGQSAGGMVADIGTGSARARAGLMSDIGKSMSSGMLADAQANAKRKSNGLGNLLSVGKTVGSIFFSDPSLKENVEKIGQVLDLGVYQWDWKPETAGTLIEKGGTVGFMADEVAEKYPEHVYEYGGFMVVDYPELLDDLRARNANA